MEKDQNDKFERIKIEALITNIDYIGSGGGGGGSEFRPGVVKNIFY